MSDINIDWTKGKEAVVLDDIQGHLQFLKYYFPSEENSYYFGPSIQPGLVEEVFELVDFGFPERSLDIIETNINKANPFVSLDRENSKISIDGDSYVLDLQVIISNKTVSFTRRYARE